MAKHDAVVSSAATACQAANGSARRTGSDQIRGGSCCNIGPGDEARRNRVINGADGLYGLLEISRLSLCAAPDEQA